MYKERHAHVYQRENKKEKTGENSSSHLNHAVFYILAIYTYISTKNVKSKWWLLHTAEIQHKLLSGLSCPLLSPVYVFRIELDFQLTEGKLTIQFLSIN